MAKCYAAHGKGFGAHGKAVSHGKAVEAHGKAVCTAKPAVVVPTS